MNKVVFLFILVSTVYADQWAIIVAGSQSWFNYRHQADACHAYQIHKAHGIPEDHIILFSYDDVATIVYNPFKGQLYNQPGDDPPNVYDGCKVTFSSANCNSKVYMAVLTGDQELLDELVHREGYPVLKSNENDTIFMSFFDHGGPYTIAFPTVDDELTADDLLKTFKTMKEKKMYKKIVYYMEACYSGSMFQDLPEDMNIYAVTAANEKESSWGYYCEDSDKIKGVHINPCLGDLFSITWMEDTDLNKKDETFANQWDEIIKRTTLSHPQQFGDKNMLNESIWDYIGNGNNNNRKSLRVQPRSPRLKSFDRAIKSRDIYLTTLKKMIRSNNDVNQTQELMAILKEEENYRRVTDNRFKLLVKSLTENESIKEKILKSDPLVVKDRSCYYDLIKANMKYCGHSREYTLNYYPTLLNLCEYKQGNSREIIESMKRVCNEIQL